MMGVHVLSVASRSSAKPSPCVTNSGRNEVVRIGPIMFKPTFDFLEKTTDGALDIVLVMNGSIFRGVDWAFCAYTFYSPNIPLFSRHALM
jgi:hypothetical protein